MRVTVTIAKPDGETLSQVDVVHTGRHVDEAEIMAQVILEKIEEVYDLIDEGEVPSPS